MELLDKLNWRYAAKAMNGKKVAQEKIDNIIEAISLAPTSSGLQPFEVMVITNQEMKEHKTRFPIVVQIAQGEIDFGVNGEKHRLVAGDLVALEGNVPHDLLALEPSVVRLSLSKMDSVERVRNVN